MAVVPNPLRETMPEHSPSIAFHDIHSNKPYPSAIASYAIRGFRGTEHKWRELTGFLDFLDGRQLHNFMLIGKNDEGTPYALSHNAPHDAQFIIIDLPLDDSSRLKGHFRNLSTIIRRGLHRQKYTYINGDPHDIGPEKSSTRSRVERALGDKTLDLLFINGDHSSEGVEQDHTTYEKFVRAGGVIAFHDIVRSDSDEPRNGMAEYWEAIKGEHTHYEFIDPLPYTAHGRELQSVGIGVIIKPKEIEN